MLTELHQNSGTAGGVYEGLYQPHRDGIVLGLQAVPVAGICSVENETNSQQLHNSHQQCGQYVYLLMLHLAAQ